MCALSVNCNKQSTEVRGGEMNRKRTRSWEVLYFRHTYLAAHFSSSGSESDLAVCFSFFLPTFVSTIRRFDSRI